MAKTKRLDYAVVVLGGVAYAILREAQLVTLGKRAGVVGGGRSAGATGPLAALEEEGVPLAERIRQRRRAAGLTQAALADRAGIRTETLNRIERGKTEPDFRTVRKLVVALRTAEAATDTGRVP
ncbi:MAG: helix-turn-helix transcriptional regulator [Phycisphaerae bacterium]